MPGRLAHPSVGGREPSGKGGCRASGVLLTVSDGYRVRRTTGGGVRWYKAGSRMRRRAGGRPAYAGSRPAQTWESDRRQSPRSPLALTMRWLTISSVVISTPLFARNCDSFSKSCFASMSQWRLTFFLGVPHKLDGTRCAREGASGARQAREALTRPLYRQDRGRAGSGGERPYRRRLDGRVALGQERSPWSQRQLVGTDMVLLAGGLGNG